MFELYKLINKKFLANLTFMVSVLPMMVLLACFFDLGSVLIDTMARVLALFLPFMALISIATSNSLFYRENMNWLLFLPIARKKYYLSHICYVFVQVFEVIFFVFSAYTLSNFVLRQKYPDFKSIWATQDNIGFFSLFENISFSVHDSTIFVLGLLLMIGFFFSILDGQKMRDRLYFLRGFNKETMTTLGVLGFIIIVSFALRGIPIFLIVTVGIVVLFWSILAQHILTFRLKFPNWMRPSLYLPLSCLFLFSLLFGMSRIHIANSEFSKGKLDDYAFLGIFAPKIGEDNFYNGLKSPHITYRSLQEYKRLYIRGRDKANLIDLQKYNYLGLIIEQKDALKSLAILQLLNSRQLNNKNSEDLIVHFKKMSMLATHKKCQNCYKRALNHLMKGEISFQRLKYILTNQKIDLTAKRYAFEKTIFSEKQGELLSIVLKNKELLEVNLSRSLQLISILQRKKANLALLAGATQSERSISSIEKIKDCNKLGAIRLSMISEEELGQLIFCSNQAFIKNYKVSKKLKPIRTWPKLPLSPEITKIITSNLAGSGLIAVEGK